MTEPKIAHCYLCSYLPPTNLTPKEKWHNVCSHILSAHKNIPTHTKRWAMMVLSEKKERVEIKPASKDPDYKPTELGVLNRLNSKVQLSGKTKEVLCYCSKCHRDYKKLIEVEYLKVKHPWAINEKPVILCDKCVGGKIKYG